MWLLLEGVSAVTLTVMGDEEPLIPLGEADPEWLVNAKSAYSNGFFITDDFTI